MFGPSVWPANTRVQLLRVPWDGVYKDVVSWPIENQNNWFNNAYSDSITIEKTSYLPYGKPVRLPIHIDMLQSYNYLRVTNDFNGKVKDYFYFITAAEYVNPNTTLVMLQVDIWTTWFREVSIHNCFIERGHVGIADFKSNTDSDGEFGQAILNLAEGLDTGPAMATVDQEFYSNGQPSEQAYMITSTINLAADPGTADNPQVVMAGGSIMEHTGDAGEIYFAEGILPYFNLLSHFRDKPHVLQGIISVVAIPGEVMNAVKRNYSTTTTTIGAATLLRVNSPGTPIDENIGLHEDFRVKFKVPHRYRHLHKFKTFPYAAIEVTNYAGQSTYFEPERIYSPHLELRKRVTIRPTDPRLAAFVKYYNARDTEETQPPGSNSERTVPPIDYGDYLNGAVTSNNFPRLSVLNNNGMMYMLSNAHSIAYQKRAAEWSQNKAVTGAGVAADIGAMGTIADRQRTANNVNAMDQTREVNNTATAIGGVTGVLGGLASGNPGGALNSGINAITQTSVNNASFNINKNQMNRATDIGVNQAMYGIDRNKRFAEFAAQGDYSTAIAGINAKIQDSEIVAPGVLGATGGDGMLTWYGHNGFMVKYKQITQSAMRSIGEYWLRFGYFVQTYAVPPYDLHAMSRFTYWKMRETYVRSTGAPEEVVSAIRGILERGVTVWRHPDDIGAIDMSDNEPIRLNYLNLKAAGEDW